MKTIYAVVTLSPLLLSALISLSAGARAEETVPSFEVYGFGMGDYVQQYDNRSDPAWEDTLRPSKIGTSPGQYGSNVQATISPRQSRLGARADLPLEGNVLATKLEFDFFGVGAQEGLVTPRLRHAYGEWGQWLGGQTHSLFMDVDVFPNVIDYWGPCGIVFLRTPQLRWTPIRGELTVAVAIEKPDTNIDPGNIRQEDPSLGANIQNDEKLPDLTGQVRLNTTWGHVQLAGILRRLGFDTLGTADNIPKGHEVGWGLDLTSTVKVLERDKLLLSANGGDGIASYMNDGGVDIAPSGTSGNLQAVAVPLFAFEVYYEHAWSDKFVSSLGYSRTQVVNQSFQAGNAYHSGEYASGNLLYMPVRNVMAGIELLWGQRTDNDFATGTDVRTQLSFKYSFSSKDFIGKI